MKQQIKWWEIVVGLIGWALLAVIGTLILIVLAVILYGLYISYLGGG